MPPWTGPDEDQQIVGSFETRFNCPDAGALLNWAVSCVRSLHYLDDLDRVFDASHAVVSGHAPQVVDVSHARWATGTCITSLDLCAAALGRAFCSPRKEYEHDLRDFQKDDKGKHVRLREKLPLSAMEWCDSVFADPRYKHILNARNCLTHKRLPRQYKTLIPNGPPQRLTLDLGSKNMSIREIVENARDVANRHVVRLIQMLPQL